jgi:hypothetical protein
LYSSNIFSAKIPDEARNRTKKWQGRAIFKPNFAGLPARNYTVLQNLCGQNTTFEPSSRAWSALPHVNEVLERNFESPIPPGVAGGFSPKITSSIYRLKICVHAEENLRKMWNLAGKSSQEVLQNSQLSRKNLNMGKIPMCLRCVRQVHVRFEATDSGQSLFGISQTVFQTECAGPPTQDFKKNGLHFSKNLT